MNDVPIAIRAASDADLGELVRFSRQSFIDTYAHCNSEADVCHYIDNHFNESRWHSNLQNSALSTLIAEQSGVLCGYAQLSTQRLPDCEVGAAPMELSRLYVASEKQGSGLANRLFADVVEKASELGAISLWLGVWEHNARAIRYYQKAGFRKVGTIGFLFGETPQIDWVMVRSLGED